MRRRRRGRARPLLLLVVVALAAALCGCAGTTTGGAVSVLASWSGAEEQQFRAVLDAFTRETGIKVHYQGTRALSQVLHTEVQKGTPPDVAVLPSPGELALYARRGDLRPLDDVLDPAQERTYSRQWRKLERAGTENRYGVAVKADVKSLVWFSPRHLRMARAPGTWDELLALGRQAPAGVAPWCMGMGAPPTSGWPGTDWIEDILLHQSGVDAYQRWVDGRLAWSSPEVRRAWAAWAAVTAPGSVRGGAGSALLTDFGDAGRPMLAERPGCLLDHQASFVMAVYQGYDEVGGRQPTPGEDFDFVPFPDSRGPEASASRVWEVSADLAGMFNDTPEARRLVRFLASTRGQEIWPGIEGASAFSVNREVDHRVYRDDVRRRVAEVLTGEDTLCFDASDLMPAAMRNAFYRAVLEFLADPGRLDALLADLDRVKQGVASGEWLGFSCAKAE
ncbi:alpha-glucoside transport system substrate-binding protein [Streptoalloteichus tenebrarius]|uniref:Alpha-glucoside transport system substrate-binding protein n=1 Tax=Streptoalloteichus tenebrarius (strain ATCC 17920 / DSM 40477 / JCM 4838 / CBS 697.72 / NBRC 16177 / NCIMB 11028 / NRRL B-12390 / A12253. 1 / ISP 5477) TaxID=1933 RepID=A0ABT1HUL7_STRSD|nr:extracellular solute-binding protein [Streptoalloteichus tenebrarius]MCP2259177.1 alpha-glucoside transport system substrate-binding protein [Streptoalloteichus tenebrarius]